jgi:hypothetical protein
MGQCRSEDGQTWTLNSPKDKPVDNFNTAAIITAAMICLWLIYMVIFCIPWYFRNPKANGMTIFHEGTHVLRFHRVDEYQK